MGLDALQSADFAFSQAIALLKQTFQNQGCFQVGSFHCTGAWYSSAVIALTQLKGHQTQARGCEQVARAVGRQELWEVASLLNQCIVKQIP